MTTSIRDDKTGRDLTSTDGAIAPPPKLRRKPGMVAVAIVAICLGAVVAGWTWSVTTNSQEVLVARTDIERGSVIEESDLTTVRLSSDPRLSGQVRVGGRPTRGVRYRERIGPDP